MDGGFSLALIDQYLELFMAAVMQASGPIQDAGASILMALIWVPVAFAALVIAVGHHATDGMIARFWKWFFTLFVVCLIGANFMTIITTGMAGMLDLGAQAGGMSAGDFVTVSKIMETGYTILDPIWAHRQMLCTGPWTCTTNLWNILKYEVAWYLIFFSFAFMVAMVIAAQVQLMYHGLASMLTIGTAALPQTAWIAERSIGGVIANLMHLLVLSLIMGIGIVIFDRINLQVDTVTINQASLTALAAMFQTYMSWRAKDISDGILNGGPNLSGGSIGAAISGAVVGAMTGGRAALAGAGAVNSASRAGNAMLWGSGSGSSTGNGASTGGGVGASPFGGGGAAGGRVGSPATPGGSIGGAGSPAPTSTIGRAAQSLRQHGIAGSAVRGVSHAASRAFRPTPSNRP